MNMNLNLVKTFTDSSFRSCTKIKWIYSSQVESITGPCFADCSNLTALVIASNTVAKLNASNAFVRTPIADGTGYIYVKDELIEQYKEATNWSAHAAQIKGLSELPEEVKTEINI